MVSVTITRQTLGLYLKIGAVIPHSDDIHSSSYFSISVM